MRMILLLAICTSGLVGCSTPKVWYQPGVNADATRIELARCKYNATLSLRNPNQIFIPGTGAGAALLYQSMDQNGQRKELIRDCMEANGYQLVPQPQAPNNPTQ